MDSRSQREKIAAAKQKLQAYKQQHQRQNQREQQPQPAQQHASVNQQEPIIPATNGQFGQQGVDVVADFYVPTHNTGQINQSQSQNEPVPFAEGTNPFIVSTIPPTVQENIRFTPPPVSLAGFGSEPESYFVTPLIPVTATDKEFPQSHINPPTTEVPEPYQNSTSHSSEQHHHEHLHEEIFPSTIYQNSVTSDFPNHTNQEQTHHSNPHFDHAEHDEMMHIELKSMQDHNQGWSHHPPPEQQQHSHNYFNDYQLGSSTQGQDAFELELSQLRQDNAHLSRRETELIGQLQDTERTLQELRRERDNLAQEVRSELGPLKDKVNILFEENQNFREKLEDMSVKVNVAETEKERKEVQYEEMQKAFIVVSNAKMELAEKLDVEKELIKVLEVRLQDRNSQIDSLTQQNQQLMQDAAELEKELDAYAAQTVGNDENQEASELADAHARIILLEKEVRELRHQAGNLAGPSGHHDSDPHHHEEGRKHGEHGHDHSQEQAHNNAHGHGHSHDHHQGEHDKNHEHHAGCDHEHEHDHHGHENHEHGHGHSHSHGQDDDGTNHAHHNDHKHEDSHSQGSHDHEHDHGHGHSYGGKQTHPQTEFGQGGHALTAAEKKQARLEWENQTYKEELEKLATLLKTKTADATAVALYKQENERMKTELDRLEHMVIQLQGENDTIGDYITLYQSQRLALKEKALQKEAEMVTLGKEREQLRIQMNELNQILRSYNKDGPNHQPLPQMPVQKINELITEINTNFHPCGVCSGRLLNV